MHAATLPRLLAGPALDGRAEPLSAHSGRLGPLPVPARHEEVVGELESSGVLGRGGAGFPVGKKWRALAERRGGTAVVVANGAEGELASWKDRVLMAHRPHLVLDGAELAARSIGADEIVLYVGSEHETAVAAIRRAIDERAAPGVPPMRLVTPPVGYVAGEASAAVHFIEAADPRPLMTPPRISSRGVRGRPTLVQNVESLAYAALIARFGAGWYGDLGRLGSAGSALATISGAVARAGVLEIELGTTIGELATAAGGDRAGVGAVLVGGYFGTWTDVDAAWDLPLDPEVMKAEGLAFGCGSVVLLPVEACGVSATAAIVDYMAGESAGQCGPCVFGLRAIADATGRIARGQAGPTDLVDVERWLPLVEGRGACHHPDGTAQLVASALAAFGPEFELHARTGRCSRPATRSVTPRPTEERHVA